MDITLSDLNYPAALTMALAGGRIQVGLNKTGTSAQVPNDYRAKLMFYMNSKYTVYNHQLKRTLIEISDEIKQIQKKRGHFGCFQTETDFVL